MFKLKKIEVLFCYNSVSYTLQQQLVTSQKQPDNYIMAEQKQQEQKKTYLVLQPKLDTNISKNTTLLDAVEARDEVYEKWIVEKLIQRFRRTHTLEDVKKIRDEITAKQEKGEQLTKAEKLSAKAVKIYIESYTDRTTEERDRLMAIAKRRAIDMLEDGKTREKRESARNQLMCDCIQWKLVERNSFAYDLLLHTNHQLINEDWINGFN